MLQLHAERPVVERLDADLREVSEMCGGIVKSLPVLEVVKLVGIAGRGRGLKCPVPGVDEIPGGHGRTVAPECIRAQVERVDRAVRGNFPAFGDARARFARRAERRQPLEQRVSKAHVELSGHQRRIERFGLAAIGENEIGPG